MVVDHADRLHMGIADSSPDKTKSPLFQVATHGIGNRCAGRDLVNTFPGILDRPVVHEAPHVIGKGAEFFPDLQKGAGIGDRRFHLQTVTDDAGIGQKLRHLCRIETGYLFGIEAGKCGAVRLPLAEEKAEGRILNIKFLYM
jgi:hypothetical protein